MSKQLNSPISAELILKSKSGRSLAKEDSIITAENIEHFRPSEKVINKAIHRLKELGFSVQKPGITLTIVGEPEKFEQVFGVKLKVTANSGQGIKIENIEQANREASIPVFLADSVEKIVFISPPEYYAQY